MPNNFTCIIVDDEQDAIDLLSYRIMHLFKNITIAGTYLNWQDALTAFREQKCDIAFMDISIPGKNAMELLKLLPVLDCELIFVTAHEEYAIEAFAFTTSGYLLKPVDDNALNAAISKAMMRVEHKRQAKQNNSPAAHVTDKIGVPNNHGIDYINIPEILYLESTNKCTRIVTGKGEYISSLNLGKFQHLVDNHSFFQVHRSYIVNLNNILRYESSGMVIMSDKKEIPVSRSLKK